jgi:hypothetical protein
MALIVGESPAKLFGLSGVERLDRSLRRLGIPRLLEGSDASRAPSDTVLLLRADHVFEEPLLAALAATPGVALHAPGEERPGALHVATADARAASRHLLAGGAPPDLRPGEPAHVAGADKLKLREGALP